MAPNKIVTKAKSVAKKAGGKAKGVFKAAKDKAVKRVEKAKDLRQKSFMKDWHFAKGEFVTTKDFRQVLAMAANLVLVFLFGITVGELVFALISYYIVHKYDHYLGSKESFGLYAIVNHMVIIFFVVIIFDVIYLWILSGYQKAEELNLVQDIRRSHICLKVTNYSSYLLELFLLVLLVKSSNYFTYLCQQFKQSFDNLIQTYNQTVDHKELMDQMQWYNDCCGKNSYKDWTQTLGNRTVPFSCCRKEVKQCFFDDLSNKHLQDIHGKGCLKEVILKDFEGFHSWVQLYRLMEMIAVFCYVVLIEIIQRSLHSQYEMGANPPVARFPTLYVVGALFYLLCLYFFTFYNLENYI